MLDQNDLAVLKNLMESVMDDKLVKSEERILSVMDDKLAKSEERIFSVMDDKLAETQEHILSVIDDRFSKSEDHVLSVMNNKLVKSENLILSEMERTRDILEKQIAQVQKNLDELNRYYSITKLEHDNTSMLLRLIDDLSKRVETLEKRTA